MRQAEVVVSLPSNEVGECQGEYLVPADVGYLSSFTAEDPVSNTITDLAPAATA